MIRLRFVIIIVALSFYAKAQEKPFELTDEWIQKISSTAPAQPEARPDAPRKVLIFDLHTGFKHWVIPHTSAVIKTLGERSGAYEAEITKDIFSLDSKNLKQYDAVVLNNNCSVNPRRNIFLDVLDKDESLSEKQKQKMAAKLEANLIKYVKKGGGLMVSHGGVTMQNTSMAFSELVGGSFDYHPPQQKLTLQLVEPDHPLVKAFDGKPFVHVDEPYLFNNAYVQKNFKPLLYIDTDELTGKKSPIEDNIRYVSWIKKHGKGRVFYVSPSHNAQSFEDERMLKFYLDGLQYALGDLECDDTPMLK
ncbi:ThuA domain-containing protein [Flavilitoribacter nigricans]|uniref:Glycosyl hydrolase n=1 Tax=Flavilitoribacter nigricans (strain ATCC 23147 / DSM 23189 / NBRC 102662 / NCIMB 1420 / SS-2) TaxID=1122177 RepID=A0A2D0N5V3_FLAN2|nr:ThuA domain-containing protein [Flavilitoribacter nigricans]PHN03778.1 glycosyl hydrolase [Flavilitoribacter nigricans DSM 23189 = NBRC 102662]